MEILRNCEIDLKRGQKLQDIKRDSSTALSSMKTLSSPKKNHITNFISQNASEIVLVPKSTSLPQSNTNNKGFQNNVEFSETDSDDGLNTSNHPYVEDISIQNNNMKYFNDKYHFKADTNENIQNISFSSIEMGKLSNVYGYCPQSEPLKRKIYTNSASINQILSTVPESMSVK